MMLEPPESLAASYRLVPLRDMDMGMTPSEWSIESSLAKKDRKINEQQQQQCIRAIR